VPSPRPISMWNMKALWKTVPKIMSKNLVNIFYKCDLDLWPSEPKINKGLVLTKTNQHITYESSMINNSQENEWTPFFTKVTLVTLTFDLKNIKSIRVKPLTWLISMWNIKPLWWTVLKIMNRNHVYFFNRRPLWPCPLI